MLLRLTMGITLGLAATIQPGPFLTYVISQALKNGWRRTLPMAFTPLISDIPVAILILLILSQHPAWLESVLRFAGGLFLLYLAVGTYKTWRNYNEEKISHVAANPQGILNAVVVNWLNPGPYLGWSLVLGPLLLEAWRAAPTYGVALLAGFYGSMAISLIGIIILFSATRRLGMQINRAMIGLTAIALAALGIYQLWLGIIPH